MVMSLFHDASCCTFQAQNTKVMYRSLLNTMSCVTVRGNPASLCGGVIGRKGKRQRMKRYNLHSYDYTWYPPSLPPNEIALCYRHIP